VVIMKIVEFRVSSGMTSPADVATLTQTLVSSQVDIGLITQSQATAVVSAVASVVDTLAPTWPSASHLATSGIGPTSLTLTWGAASDDFQVTSYRIYQGNTLIATVSGSVYTLTVTGLTPGTSYIFTVQAGDGADNWSTNGPSTQASAFDSLAPTWASGSHLTASDIAQMSLTLTWTVAADDVQVTNYRIYEGSALIATVAGSVYTYTVTGLSPGTSYTFTVQAGDGANNWSNNGPSTPASTLASSSPVPPAPEPTIFGLAPWLFYSIVGGVVVLVAVISAVIIVSRKRRGT